MSSMAFQEVNDSIRGLVGESPSTQEWEFFCECADGSCHTLVILTLDEFDSLRGAVPPEPVLAPHHT